MIKIAITDDHPLIIKGIAGLIENEADMQLIARFDDGNSTIEGIADLHGLDVLLLDVNLPDIDGEEVCKKIMGIRKELNILVLTSFDETGILKRMIQAGAKGFIIKNTSDIVILEAIRSVNNGNQYIQKELQDKLVAESLMLKKEVGYLPKLTRREKEILKYITDQFTTSEIAKELYISPKTVETHRLNMLQKLNVKNTAGLVKLAISNNLI